MTSPGLGSVPPARPDVNLAAVHPVLTGGVGHLLRLAAVGPLQPLLGRVALDSTLTGSGDDLFLPGQVGVGMGRERHGAHPLEAIHLDDQARVAHVDHFFVEFVEEGTFFVRRRVFKELLEGGFSLAKEVVVEALFLPFAARREADDTDEGAESGKSAGQGILGCGNLGVGGSVRCRSRYRRGALST